MSEDIGVGSLCPAYAPFVFTKQKQLKNIERFVILSLDVLTKG